MTRSDPRELFAKSSAQDTRWITATVALLATLVFAISGSQVVPAVFDGATGIGHVSQGQIAAFLLNIALLLLAWRRSSQLKQSFSERHAWEQRAIDLAYHDEVTGLFNRRYLKETYDFLHVRIDATFVLLLIDLDHFKKVNDVFGHEVGDELLSITANRIEKLCPDDAFCVRLGGDEFAILLTGEAHDMKSAKQLAAQLIDDLKAPVQLANGEILAGASIGIAGCADGQQQLGELLQAADIAMYEAKRLGGNRWIEADPEMVIAMHRRNVLEAEMRAGLENGEFLPHFQPIIDLSSGETRGFEVLARWQHPAKGMLEPGEFLDTAISSGLIAELSLAVMQEALCIARDWPSDLKIAVNVSPVQFRDPLLAERILKLLTLTGFPASRLELEIAESSLIADHAFALSTIQSLKEVGIGIVVDDFGTGYASVTQLRNLPFDRLKIDRSFVDAMHGDASSDALVQVIATLGKALSIPISAEGVETETIQAKLVELGCTDAQGWLFAKALSPDEVEDGFRNGAFRPDSFKTRSIIAAQRY